MSSGNLFNRWHSSVIMNIGSLKLANPYILAPMEGVNCASFRVLCKRRGASLVFTDVIDADEFAFYVKNNSIEEAVARYINPQKEEMPLAVQLAGAKIDNLAVSVEVIQKYASVIDFNIGCPLKDVLAKKAGAYLMKHPEQLYKILRVLRQQVKIPLTLKMRSGWDEENALEICKEAEAIGIDAVTIHPRTLKQGYQGDANWQLVKKIKSTINIPVILSGDVVSSESAQKAFEVTGCDCIMVGRAARVNPSIFKHLNEKTKGHTKIYCKDGKEAKSDFKDFLELYKHIEFRYKFSQVRDHALWFATECKNNTEVTQEIIASENEDDLASIMNRLVF